MAGSVNKVILVGNLGADPEIRRTQTGKPIVNMRLATTESWRDKTSGERRERTEWHKIVVFSEGLAKVAENYLRKGAKIYIEGQLQTRKWVDDKNVERYTTEIVLQGFNSTLTMLDSRTDRISADNGPRDSFSKSEPNFSSSATEDLDDEIPF